MATEINMVYPPISSSSDKFNVIQVRTEDGYLPPPHSESLEAQDVVLLHRVSTPFTSSSPIFEYPFPPYAAGSDPSFNTISQPSTSNLISWPSLPHVQSRRSSFVSSPSTASSSSIPVSSYPNFKINLPSIPIPPSLKKRPNWTLSLSTKKRNTQSGVTNQSDSIDRVLGGGCQ